MKPKDPNWRVQVAWADNEGQRRSQAASIVTIDENTVKLAVGEELPLCRECTIALVAGDGVARPVGTATVHYLRATDGAKHVSCRWSVPLSQSLLDLLAGCGVRQRRTAERRQVTLQGPAIAELSGPTEAIPASVVDLSTGGCCIKSPQEVPVGHRILIHAWSEQSPVVAIPVRVQWQQSVGEEFLLGCSFTQRSGHTALAPFVEE